MVIRSVKSILRRRRCGALITEVVIAMGLLTFAMLPLAFSIVREQKLTRAYFNRAIVMEIIDGEMEILMAGEWREFKEGVQTYPLPLETAKNLPPGKARLTITGKRIRLEWLPEQKYSSGKILRESVIK